MENVLNIIKSEVLTFEQKVNSLAKEAENSVHVLKISKRANELREEGIICDLFEGNAPYRPRYIVPNYEVFMKNGSKFLQLEPAEDIHDAINNLLILYKHVPSITTFPVYIGNIDYLLESYVEEGKEEEAYKAIRNFLKHIDRTITDSFCHANIGPLDTKAGRMILRAEKEMENSTPNITLKYGEETSDEFAKLAIETSLKVAKPSFANNEMYRGEFNGDYGIASCYNGLNIGGGSYTLVRLVMPNLAFKTDSIDVFLDELLPETVNEMLGYMDERIKFIIEDVKYFDNSFLVDEGLIAMDNFSAMFGMVGLAETVNHFSLKDEKYGSSDAADEIGIRIMDKLESLIMAHRNKYLMGSDERYMLHGQVGIDSDVGITPTTRIPIGDEPEVYELLERAGKYHKYFPSGTGEVIRFDQTAENNPQYVLDILKGAFDANNRYVSYYCEDADVVRVTGYLVKRSEIEKLNKGEKVLRDTTILGKGADDNLHVFDRKIVK